MNRSSTVFVPLILCIAVGCNLLSSSDSNDGEITAQVTTGKQEYVLSDEAIIDLKIENRSSIPIYYSTCDSGTLEEVSGTDVTQSIVFTNPCECICTFVIEPAEEDDLEIHGYLLSEHRDKLALSNDTRYRVLPHFYSDQDLQNRISPKSVQAGLFVLRGE